MASQNSEVKDSTNMLPFYVMLVFFAVLLLSVAYTNMRRIKF